MKKLSALLLSVLFVMMFFTGCSNDGETFQARTYTPNEAIRQVNIDVHDREVEVSLSSDEQVHIDYFESDKEYYDISVSDDGVLTMDAESDKSWQDYIGGKTSAGADKISLQVPDRLLETLVITTTKGDITLPALNVTDSLSLITNSGDINFDRLNAENTLTLENKNGDIKGSILGGYDDYTISCSIKKGESNLPDTKEGGQKTLKVTNNNGDIAIDFVKP
ncbi:hypothetical protein BN3661_00075 [Eubacteriaceae bacterium CHKCI005]|uniref:DUF4097 domain-containing protein n=1 Tax=Solibaculum mannosilyticum TaxID=2780922 RepID=A0A7I8D2W6_9FIRM|nr:DUF4097 family beta strand repeat-containing protein [Solibaculum mannosilyticum]BCI60335.1 hypothetical protein C12CBH8_09740 [Solibaculum mannosilyticum]CZT55004.1 hypothetical protein BN3661_00075 [Eubacteriaceae bacterium CHKCI005]